MVRHTFMLAGLLLTAACMSSGGKETLIGESCKTADECDPTGVCIVDGKDGMCTQRCMYPGQPGECPLGSYCTRNEFESDASGGKGFMVLCLPACKSQFDCREGYACNDLSAGPGKVCEPE